MARYSTIGTTHGKEPVEPTLIGVDREVMVGSDSPTVLIGKAAHPVEGKRVVHVMDEALPGFAADPSPRELFGPLRLRGLKQAAEVV